MNSIRAANAPSLKTEKAGECGDVLKFEIRNFQFSGELLCFVEGRSACKKGCVLSGMGRSEPWKHA